MRLQLFSTITLPVVYTVLEVKGIEVNHKKAQ
jgi:hypothetical protein